MGVRIDLSKNLIPKEKLVLYVFVTSLLDFTEI